jgi:ATP-binding cassette subfamily F protein uup
MVRNLLAKENITLFMVTHDRFFLERVCNEIIELDNGKLYSYKGNYLLFREKRRTYRFRKFKCGQGAKSFVKELEWMRRQPREQQNQNRVRKILRD